MHHLFLDESGEFGTKTGSSQYFLITVLSTMNVKALEKRVHKEKSKLYNAGWPKQLEIKGTTLWGADHYPAIPTAISSRRVDIIGEILEAICASPIDIHHCICKKKHLKPHLLAAEYGIAYNYFCGTLLCRAYKHYTGPLSLVVDQRSKETHSKMKFDGYVATRLVTECDHAHPLTIAHAESHDVLGLQAVDLISWSLFRRYEHRDTTFSRLLDARLCFCDDWYSRKP